MRQTEDVVEMDAHAKASAGPFIALLGKALCLVKNVRIVPIYENTVHVDRLLFSHKAACSGCQ